VVVLFSAKGRSFFRGGSNQELKFDAYRISFQFPDSLEDWKPDEGESSPKAKMGANLPSYRKTDEAKPGWYVMQARTFEYTPGETELKSLVQSQLSKIFEELPEELEASEDQYLGEKALRLVFRGVYTQTNQTCAGEVYTVATKGVVYLAYAWGPEQTVEQLKDDFSALRNGLKFLPDIKNAREPKPLKKDYRAKGDAYKYFIITDHEALWTLDRNVDPKSRDEAAVLLLEGNFVRKPNTAAPAELLVCVLPGGGEAKALAEEHLKKQFSFGGLEPQIEVITAEPTGDPPKVSGIKPESEITRWRLRYKGADASANKLVVFSYFSTADKVILAYAAASGRDIPKWEQRMMLITASLKKP
jgi:hypothetical protein